MRLAAFVLVAGVFAWLAYQIRAVKRAQVEAQRGFDARLDSLNDAITEGLHEAEREEATVIDAVQSFERQAVHICSHADAVVFAFTPSNGFAMGTKVGRC